MTVAIQEQNIPSLLKSRNQWICWNLEGKTNSFKGTKIPYAPKNPHIKASTTDPVTWESFGYSISIANMHGMSGIGYVFTEDQGIVAIDIDNALTDTGIEEKAQKALDLFAGKTYIEKSHSGKGFHILCKGKMPAIKLKGIEVYNSGRYFAITGHLFEGITDITEMQKELEDLYILYTDTTKLLQQQPHAARAPSNSESWVDYCGLRVQDIGYPIGATQHPDGEIRGAHPFHGSTTGNNYAINTHKNTWICRRDGHNSGGGPLELFAVEKGIINCEDAGRGCLDNKWKELADALKKAGHTLPDKPRPVPPREPQEDENAPRRYREIKCTDFGNGERFLNRYSNDVLYSQVQKTWYIWNKRQGLWESDHLLKVREIVKDVFQDIYAEAALIADADKRGQVAKWAVQCEKPDHLNACLNVAMSDARIVVHPDKFDVDKYLLNMKNGTYDLRTHEFLPHDKQNYITKTVPYAYDKDATCPKFLKFIDRIFKSRPDKIEIIEYIQKALGYSLTGEISQQAIFLLYGSGANGKSTLIETQRMVIGDYGTTIDSGSLTTKKNDSVRNDIARLPGIRFASASENSKGTILDEELVKKLSGGDQIAARFLYQEEFTFTPQLKLWWAFNHPPGLNDFTHSLMRRLKLIPFQEVIEGKEIIDQAVILGWHREELAGIFNWEIEGLKKFQIDGLKDISAIRNAVKEFREEQDRLHDFINDDCYRPGIDGVPEVDLVSSASLLCKRFNDWAERNNEKPMSQRKFSMEMKERGFRREHTKTGNVFHGIGVK